MSIRAFVVGCEGPVLNPDERSFLREAQPWGLILFGRNCVDPVQVRALTAEFRNLVGRADAEVLIDQEGGRVQRLRPPHWPSLPPLAAYGTLEAADSEIGLAAARLAGDVTGDTLARLGISIDCAPVGDLTFPETHAAIGDRSFGADPEKVAALSQAFADGLMAAGVAPVLKHMPGHGRAQVDSHHALPVVTASAEDLERDFAPFQMLRHFPIGITAHVIYEALDPLEPGTLSPIIIGDVIRRRIGFHGILLSDDISMSALSGPVGERARRAWAAGVDIVLHCNGDFSEMQAIAAEAPVFRDPRGVA